MSLSTIPGARSLPGSIARGATAFSISLATLVVGGCGPLSSERGSYAQGGAIYQQLRLEARYLYRGRAYVDDLPVECWFVNQAKWSGPVTVPRAVVSKLSDGSVLILDVSGLCGDLRDAAKLNRTGFEAAETFVGNKKVKFGKPLGRTSIDPPAAIWLDHPSSPRIIDTYLTRHPPANGVGYYVPVSFSVREGPPRRGEPDPETLARKGAPAAIQLNKWTARSCGGLIVEVPVDSVPGAKAHAVVQDLSILSTKTLGKSSQAHWVDPGITKGESPERARVSQAAVPLLYEAGVWRAGPRPSSLLRRYRKGDVTALKSFQLRAQSVPFGDFAVLDRARGTVIFNSNFCR